ncbi:UpxY family transcription antiterminator [Bacteroides thetaiotaomicron]|uniref:UpxY family transcription antiterminator n=1 Tax=Bacteroides thetaiotaomicron TaxID=818 RepID=UPI001F1D0B0F|nr:UpxY family transcription antiterminator [Bacteroides thetaiotaomicron]MCE8718034.1 UpxY family transcription antiterminator [Bacteroides thetaiotaomicron]
MVNVLDKDKILWYVMRAYKNENTAEDRLSNETYGLEYFIPKQKVLRTVKGKKVFFMVPVIHSLVFVHASHQKIVDFKHNYYYDLQFVTWKSGGELVYLTVPDEDMTNFIKVCKQADEEVHFYKISEINKDINRHIAVRDFLRTHPDIALEYGELKMELAYRFSEDIEGYCTGKDAFVKQLEKDALLWYQNNESYKTR